MQALILSAYFQELKNELRELLPDTKPSHRVEAMARGLGWKTYAAMRAALRVGSYLRRVDEETFKAYLTEHNFPDTQLGVLSEAVVRARLPHEWNATHDEAQFNALMEGLISRATQSALSGVNDVASVLGSMLGAVDQYILQWNLAPKQTNDWVLLAFRDHAIGVVADEFFDAIALRLRG